ncbi:hypothetical protein EV379_2779 [Microterricola gilva]|uniref:Sodium:proton antiporter n=1 Tax=Microterricola gilva TaxID=393267 RepID=A0A4Q8AQM3_9MICO|nr:DUF6328 family protein [Microterricola gilva]RZU66423.1 hypothetical protein EV379_2779 [Microterricola gilva]
MSESAAARAADAAGAGESEKERLDRNWNELLQELRVVQTGTQIITGFLLTAVFQSRFEELDTFQLATYLLLVATSILTTIAGLAPVSLHRYLFRRRAKDKVLAHADRFAQLTLIGVAVTVVGIGMLIFDFVLGRFWGIAAAVVIAIVLIAVWVLVPVRVRAADRPEHTPQN